MKEQESLNFKTECGICGKTWETPQYPEQEPSQVGVTRVIICQDCQAKITDEETLDY